MKIGQTQSFPFSDDFFNFLLHNKQSLTSDKKERESAQKHVINYIKKEIMEGRLQAGDQLPNEYDLAEQLGVSRGSVREAIKVLQSYGVIKIQRGDGMYITKGDLLKTLEPLLFSIVLSKVDKSEIYKLRCYLEQSILNEVIENASESDIQYIRSLIEEMRQLYSQNPQNQDEFVKSDYNFHIELAKITKNNLLQGLYSIILCLSFPFIRQTYESNPCNHSHALEDHEEILKAIENRDLLLGKIAIDNTLNHWMQRSELNNIKD